MADAVAQDPGKPVRIENPKELKLEKIDKNAEKIDIKKEEIKKNPEKIDEKQLTKPIIEAPPKPKPDAPAKIEPRKDQVKPVKDAVPERKPAKPIKDAAPEPKPDKPVKAAPEPPKNGRPVGELKDKPEKEKKAHKERVLTPEQKECKIERTACRQDCKALKNECGKGKKCADLHKACKAECDKKFVCH